ncbi:MAG: glycosyltransferase [Bacteroidales bacterium]
MNHTQNYEMTILVPLYNEADNIQRLQKELTDYLNHAKLKSCVIFINDGSKDNSLELIKKACNENENFYFLSFDHNYGLSAALKAGFEKTASPFVAYIDADLQTSPEDFELLIPYIKNHSLVTGIRSNRKDSFTKRMSSKIANGFRRKMTNDGVEDTGCPLKIIQTPIAREIPFFKGMHRFLPALVLLHGGTIYQIPVRHFPRMAGEAKYNLKNRMIAPFVDCFAYKWMEKRYIRYKIKENQL